MHVYITQSERVYINCTDLSSTSVCLVNKFIVIVARIFNHAWSNTPKGDWDNPTGGWIKLSLSWFMRTE